VRLLLDSNADMGLGDENVCPKQKMKACPCKTVWYCSTDCQRQLWKKEHKPDHQRILEKQQEE
jgi:hypothetical protein